MGAPAGRSRARRGGGGPPGRGGPMKRGGRGRGGPINGGGGPLGRPMRGGPMGMRGGPRPPLPPPPMRGRGGMRGMPGPPRGMMGIGPRGMPPSVMRPPPGIRPPPPGMRPPPPMMMMHPAGPPLGRGGFRGGMRGGMKPGFPRGGMRGGIRGGRIIKKNRPSLKNVDLTKSWVTDAIKAEFYTKDQLLAVAKNTQSQDDWAKYREQREKCSRVYQQAESENVGQPEGVAANWEDYVYPEDELDCYDDEEEDSYSCDTCERDFNSKDQFDKHMSEHRTCNLDGCKFTAHEKIIEKHIQMQHSTGLYNKIKLDTPEDVAKWIEARKKNFPSRENIEKRYELQEELLKKGVRIAKNPNKFGKDKFRLTSTAKQSNPRSKFSPSTSQPVRKKRKPRAAPKMSLIDLKADWNGSMFPFKGTSQLFSNPSKTEEVDVISDLEEEWQNENRSKTTDLKVNNSLTSLMAAYDSDNDSDVDAVVNAKKEVVKEQERVCKVGSDDECPEEVKIEKKSEPTEQIVQTTQAKMKRKKMQHRQGIGKKRSYNNASEEPQRVDNFPHNKFKRRRVTLLEKLLESEIRHERNLLLQCVRYVVQNNFLK
ncbi:FMR1-interacting protein NUFIP1-like [Euwallacea similis]|uniref:FMR1-interacting protein NUFIP1-like n=1 Tax=Euwallacea similis TaxID=1736056 RepID=UPI00344F7ACC